VEKKRDRSRSSGKVEGADATMICSMITSDNYYPSVVGPFVSAMMEDSSYLRRYSFLMLSDGTHTRGRSHSKVVDWRKSTDQLLFKRGIKPFQWGKLMSYWRSQIPDAMRRLDLSLYQKFGDKYAKDKVDALFFKGGINKETIKMYPDLEKIYIVLGEINLYQLIVACMVSAVIMQSTFNEKKEEFPVLRFTKEAEDLGKDMFTRLVDDLFDLMKPYVESKVAEESKGGVRRVASW